MTIGSVITLALFLSEKVSFINWKLQLSSFDRFNRLFLLLRRWEIHFNSLRVLRSYANYLAIIELSLFSVVPEWSPVRFPVILVRIERVTIIFLSWKWGTLGIRSILRWYKTRCSSFDPIDGMFVMFLLFVFPFLKRNSHIEYPYLECRMFLRHYYFY